MKRHAITPVRVFAAAAVAAFLVLPSDPSFGVETGEIVIHSRRVDITHGIGTEPIDQVDVMITFTNTEASEHGVCHASDSPVKRGVVMSLQEGGCGATSPPVLVTIPKFTPMSPGSTFARFEGITVEKASVDALLRALPKPTGACGRFNLTLDALPLDLSSITANPVALTIRLPDGSTGCVTVSNAIIE